MVKVNIEKEWSLLFRVWFGGRLFRLWNAVRPWNVWLFRGPRYSDQCNRVEDTANRLSSTDNLSLRSASLKLGWIVIRYRAHMTVEKLRHLTLVQSVLLRPRMYTVTGSLCELLAFFNGCQNPGTRETRDDGSVRAMFEWLRNELGIESEYVLPKLVYDTAISHFGDDTSTINAIGMRFLDPQDIARDVFPMH